MIEIDQFYRPGGLDEALLLLAELPNPRPLAGGTDLLVQLHRDAHLEELRQRPAKPWMSRPVQLVDLSGIPELRRFEVNDRFVKLGAGVRLSEIAANGWFQANVPFLAAAAASIGSPQIRNLATIGGNICNASPAADSVPPLLCLDAEVQICYREGERTISLRNFATGPQQNGLQKGELVTGIRFEVPGSGSRQFFRKLGQRKGTAIAKINLALMVEMNADTVADVRVALGAVAPTVIRATETERFLKGKPLTDSVVKEAARICRTEVAPIDDIRSTREYRSAMAGTLLEMGLREVSGRAE